MSVQSIAQDVFGSDKTMSDEQKEKEAQKIFDAVMNGFPHLRDAILGAQVKARKVGYTETMTGRRRHHPDMQLPKFEFVADKGYANPDVDPLDPSTMVNKDKIPERIVKQLTKEFNGYKYYGQIVKRTKALAEEGIKVVNNTRKIDDASRQIWNSIIQGSAADLTKMAMIRLTNNPEWHQYGGRFIDPIHDELMCEVPAVYAEEGARILKESMEGAGDFLPFPIRCDIESTYRWYGIGIEDIESFDKPDAFDKSKFTESNIKWIQAMLCEAEFLLPVLPRDDGADLKGVETRGVNGKWTDELDKCIETYMAVNDITIDQFLDHIEERVIYGK